MFISGLPAAIQATLALGRLPLAYPGAGRLIPPSRIYEDKEQETGGRDVGEFHRG